jgi:DNA-binding NarL/FixJ family response regulator
MDAASTPQHDRTQLKQELFQKIKTAETVYRAAAAEYKSTKRKLREMRAHPDAARAWYNAAGKERLAIQQYVAALRAFTDFVVYNRSPAVAIEPQEPNVNVLTRREIEVLKLIAVDLNTKQIAAHLRISVRTVASHRSHIMGKLGIHHVVSLLRYAIRHKLIEL